MKTHKKIDLHGFTIIEVVLVLAIAGLIFLMVFVALPALQRSQRDTQRRSDMARVATALTNYQTNNNGELPTNNNPEQDFIATDFLNNYIKVGGDFKDPSGKDYSINIKKTKESNWQTIEGSEDKYQNPYTSSSSEGTIYIVKQGSCYDDSDIYQVKKSTGKNDFAIIYKLEGSGIYCVDNK